MTYTVFVRNWWRRENGRKVPGPGRKSILFRHVATEDRARDICRVYNENHDPGPLSRKAEYESE